MEIEVFSHQILQSENNRTNYEYYYKVIIDYMEIMYLLVSGHGWGLKS